MNCQSLRLFLVSYPLPNVRVDVYLTVFQFDRNALAMTLSIYGQGFEDYHVQAIATEAFFIGTPYRPPKCMKLNLCLININGIVKHWAGNSVKASMKAWSERVKCLYMRLSAY